MSDAGHWNAVFRGKPADELSWHQPEPTSSLRALDGIGATATSALIDIGGGQSSLVNTLLARGWSDVTVLDISEAALRATKTRLGEDARRIRWIAADVAHWQPGRTYDIWHDRAAFHFLLTPQERAAYHDALHRAVRPGGHAIFATFAPDGPRSCSELPVRRYAAADIATELGGAFALRDDWREDHVTPAGAVQAFTWAVFRRSG